MGERQVARAKIDFRTYLGQEKSQRDGDTGDGDQLTPGGFKRLWIAKGDCFDIVNTDFITSQSHLRIIMQDMSRPPCCFMLMVIGCLGCPQFWLF